MSQTEPPSTLLDNLTTDLAPDQRAEFFQIVHESGISPDDKELARLLKALQLYKGYYETIPTVVQQAGAAIEHVRQEVDKLNHEFRLQAANVTKLAKKVVSEAQRFESSLTAMHSQVEEAIQRSAEALASQMPDLLRSTLIEPVRKSLADSHRLMKEQAEQNRLTAAALKKEVGLARKIHLHGYVLAALIATAAISCALWAVLHWSYAAKLEAARLQAIQQNERNRHVLTRLALSNRVLELVEDRSNPRKHYLMMKDATGWQTQDRQAVIEFKE